MTTKSVYFQGQRLVALTALCAGFHRAYRLRQATIP